jgi:uncharacterized protein YjdB
MVVGQEVILHYTTDQETKYAVMVRSTSTRTAHPHLYIDWSKPEDCVIGVKAGEAGEADIIITTRHGGREDICHVTVIEE